MQDQQSLPQPQFSTPHQAAMASGNNQPLGVQEPVEKIMSAQSDLLTQASEAVESCLARTVSNPSARMDEISKIRAAYIKAKFGMDMQQ